MSDPAPLLCLVDDDASVRTGLGRLLRSAGHRVQSFATAGEFLNSDILSQVGCLLLDVRLPEMTGPELQEELHRRGVPAPIVFITGHGDVATGIRAMKNGAVDFLQKPFNDTDLLDAVGRALERDHRRRDVDDRRAALQHRLDTLTPAERSLLPWLTTGLLNKQIARNLGVKEKTVRVHRGRVLHKMGACSVAELVRMAHTLRIDPPTV